MKLVKIHDDIHRKIKMLSVKKGVTMIELVSELLKNAIAQTPKAKKK